MTDKIYAGIDAGGTEFKCLVASGPEQVLAQAKIPVTYPEATLAACRDFFLRAQAEHGDDNLQVIGVAVDHQEDVVAYARTAEFNYPILIGLDDAIAAVRAAYAMEIEP